MRDGRILGKPERICRIMNLVGKDRTRVITIKKTGNLPCAMNKNIHPAAMSPEVQELFSGDIRDQCFSRFGVKSALLISNWHSFTFEAEISTGPCILKITHSSHRTYDQIEAEIEWLQYLVSEGIPAPLVQPSIQSSTVEQIQVADGYFSIVAYEKLIGEAIGDRLWSDSLFRRWGNLIGRLHCVSRGYAPKKRRYSCAMKAMTCRYRSGSSRRLSWKISERRTLSA